TFRYIFLEQVQGFFPFYLFFLNFFGAFVFSKPSLSIFSLFFQQTLFTPGELSGTYLKKLDRYQRLFEIIALRSHESCLLLCSREKPKEIDQWEGGTSPIRTLELKGSKEVAIALFQEKQLNDETHWSTAIDYWQGHPLQLQEISILIRDVFGGDISQFSEYATHFVGNNLKEKIEQHLERLSGFERDVILAFDGENDSLPIGKLMTKSGLIPAEFFNVVQSLQRRFCLETQQKERIKHFSLPSLLQNHLKVNSLE
ncbi:MAG: hypothetical protein J7647_25265, partial [Cyanobacteria bacterium SBLK]|nr:hypothetical protein [Cyanobacteria bacterium SBLK]